MYGISITIGYSILYTIYYILYLYTISYILYPIYYIYILYTIYYNTIYYWKAWAGEQFLLPDCMAKARRKGLRPKKQTKHNDKITTKKSKEAPYVQKECIRSIPDASPDAHPDALIALT